MHPPRHVALERIGERVDETDASVQEISRVVAEQSETLEGTVGVAERVGSVSEEVSAQTGAVAETIRDQTTAIGDVTENAQQLERMAADLRDLTGEFSLEESVREAAESEVDVEPGVETPVETSPEPAAGDSTQTDESAADSARTDDATADSAPAAED